MAALRTASLPVQHAFSTRLTGRGKNRSGSASAAPVTVSWRISEPDARAEPRRLDAVFVDSVVDASRGTRRYAPTIMSS